MSLNVCNQIGVRVFNQSTAKERYAAAKEFIEVINGALREGYIFEEAVSTEVDLTHCNRPLRSAADRPVVKILGFCVTR